MGIAEAAKINTVLRAALAYNALGISVLPCKRTKEPSIKKWDDLQIRSASPARIQRWDEQGMLQNVGIICGKVSRGLTVIDLDSETAVTMFLGMFPELAETYSVKTARGLHLYYQPQIVPPTTRVTGSPEYGAIELRAEGCYVLAPPSTHPSGVKYRIGVETSVMRPFSLDAVVGWIKQLIRVKNGGALPPANGRMVNGQQIRNHTAYGLAALQAECDNVSAANTGNRNETLFRAALKLSKHVVNGHLSRAEVERALFNAAAALASSDGEQSVTRTINSGLNIGIRNQGQ